MATLNYYLQDNGSLLYDMSSLVMCEFIYSVFYWCEYNKKNYCYESFKISTEYNINNSYQMLTFNTSIFFTIFERHFTHVHHKYFTMTTFHNI